MLWHAGQKRVSREARDRLAELYVGVRDGYVAATVQNARMPDYAKPDSGRAVSRRGLRQLIADFPGAVAGKPEFTN